MESVFNLLISKLNNCSINVDFNQSIINDIYDIWYNYDILQSNLIDLVHRIHELQISLNEEQEYSLYLKSELEKKIG